MLNSLPLADSTFTEIRDYIYAKSGIFISDSKKYLLENRLMKILQENRLKSFEEYYEHIKTSVNGRDLNRLFDAVTTNETYFFREHHQIEVLVDTIIPALLKQKKGKKTIKIWSAACSTGEEPYTISMVTREKGLSPNLFEIYASDISDNALQSAKKAVYNTYSVRNVPEHYIKKYFSVKGPSYSLSPDIINSVKFMKVNLFDDKNTRPFRGMDIILCRNVLIYFDNKAKQKTVSNLYNSLNAGGYLLIGSSESLHFVTRAFRPGVLNKVVTYQKI